MMLTIQLYHRNKLHIVIYHNITVSTIFLIKYMQPWQAQTIKKKSYWWQTYFFLFIYSFLISITLTFFLFCFSYNSCAVIHSFPVHTSVYNSLPFSRSVGEVTSSLPPLAMHSKSQLVCLSVSFVHALTLQLIWCCFSVSYLWHFHAVVSNPIVLI